MNTVVSMWWEVEVLTLLPVMRMCFILGWKIWQTLRTSAQTSSVTERCLFMVIYEEPTWKITARFTCQVFSFVFVELLGWFRSSGTLKNYQTRQKYDLEVLEITPLWIICQSVEWMQILLVSRGCCLWWFPCQVQAFRCQQLTLVCECLASWVLSSRRRRFCCQRCQFSPRPLCSSGTAKEALFEWEGEAGLCAALWSWGCAVWQGCCLCRPRWEPWLSGNGKKESLLNYCLQIFVKYCVHLLVIKAFFLLIQAMIKRIDYKRCFSL